MQSAKKDPSQLMTQIESILKELNGNIEEMLTSVNGTANTVYLRNIYLKEADNAFNAGNIPRSVFYQTEALCMLYRFKYLFENPIDPYASPLYDFSQGEIDHIEIDDNPLYQYAAELSKKYRAEQMTCNSKSDTFLQTDPVKGFQDIQQFCQSLPKEWTVLQLSKKYYRDLSISTSHEILTAPNSIYLTVLKNVLADSYPEPICFSVDLCKDDFNLFSTFYNLGKTWKANNFKDGVVDEKVAFNVYRANIDLDLSEAIERLRKAIGPWKCFFAGPVIASDRPKEQKLYVKVKEFATNHNLDSKQFVILFSLARQIGNLTKQDVQEASLELAGDENSDLVDHINRFLVSLSLTLPAIKCTPCILIVDEHLDAFFWETINEHQELCRVSSLHLLRSLFHEYANQISEGYVKLPINRGVWILNPDKTLKHMESRLSAFIEFWKPKLRQCDINREMPTAATVTKYLTENDMLIYSGHGSGLQFFSGDKITKTRSKSVIFLLGCDSTQLKSDGFLSEMTGSHLYYFATGNPAIVGALVLMFDRTLDLMTAEIFSKWVPTKGKIHWNRVDKKVWAKEGEITILKNDITQAEYEPKLSAILRNIRVKSQTFLERVCLVYRGLPVCNLNLES